MNAFTPSQLIHPATTRRGVAVFLAIAFALAWLPFAPTLVGGEPAAPFLMPFAPAIAAVVMRKWVTREGFGDAGLRPHLRHWRLYLLAAGWPILTTLLSVPLGLMFGAAPDGFTVPWGIEAPGALTLLTWIALSVAIAPIVLGEELGWRGYLQLRLFPGRPWHAAIATGLIWAAWHYPWLLATDQFPYSNLAVLPLFTVAVTSLSVFLGWLRARTGDIWSASIGHGANNITENSWHRLAFTGDASGKPTLAADVTLLIAEAVMLIGIVTASGLRRPRRTTVIAART
jgi:membrane protease YdiL (CAAX protease family)